MRREINRREFLKATAATSVVWMAGASSLSFAQGEKDDRASQTANRWRQALDAGPAAEKDRAGIRS